MLSENSDPIAAAATLRHPPCVPRPPVRASRLSSRKSTKKLLTSKISTYTPCTIRPSPFGLYYSLFFCETCQKSSSNTNSPLPSEFSVL